MEIEDQINYREKPRNGMHLMKLLASITLVTVSILPLFSFASVDCDADLPLTSDRDDVLILVNDNSRDSCDVGKHSILQ